MRIILSLLFTVGIFMFLYFYIYLYDMFGIGIADFLGFLFICFLLWEFLDENLDENRGKKKIK